MDETFRFLAEDVHFDTSCPSHFKLFSILNEIEVCTMNYYLKRI
jgi:hypothetical protein